MVGIPKVKTLIAALVVLAFVGTSFGGLTLSFTQAFPTKPDPDGAAPWLTITFEDSTDDATIPAGTVRMIITASLSGGNTIKKGGVYLNVAAAHVGNLTFTACTMATAGCGMMDVGQAFDGSPTQMLNSLKADGDGRYDIKIEYDNSDPLSGTEVSRYLITSTVMGLNPQSFNELSVPDGGHGPFIAAAHVQEISAPAGSTWIAPANVPEPETLVLLGIGMLGLFLIRRRTRAT